MANKVYDVWCFSSCEARKKGDLSEAQKVGTVSNFKGLLGVSDENLGPLGYTLQGTKEIISYADVMASWGEEPWVAMVVEKNNSHISLPKMLVDRIGGRFFDRHMER